MCRRRFEHCDWRDLCHSLQIENVTLCKAEAEQDSAKCAIIIWFDLSSAFDTDDPSFLLNRLKHQVGIQGIALQWFTYYLTHTVDVSLSTRRTSSTPLPSSPVEHLNAPS
ncbi:unnamed protein product [Pleuronectes platessa]|uniref:Reverse transcriptase domain-containing protein n=1 Tax=Pleuronectes platessa TaxID=8262 RepID=A0A9N7Z020_PLEPL|nr:unnamed protein product [Pleuronectes platessa]